MLEEAIPLGDLDLDDKSAKSEQVETEKLEEKADDASVQVNEPDSAKSDVKSEEPEEVAAIEEPVEQKTEEAEASEEKKEDDEKLVGKEGSE